MVGLHVRSYYTYTYIRMSVYIAIYICICFEDPAAEFGRGHQFAGPDCQHRVHAGLKPMPQIPAQRIQR